MNREKEQLLKALNNKLEVLDDFFTNKARDESRGNASCFLNLQNQYGEKFLEIKDSFLDEAILDNGIYVKLISTINELEKQYFDLNIDFEDIEELIQDSYASLNFDEKIDILNIEEIKEFIECLDTELYNEVCEESLKYESMGFNDKQMEQIRLGLEKGLDVTKYANLAFDSMQMLEIRWGLGAGLNVDKYANPKFNFYQMEEIRKELENKKQKESEMEI